MRIEDDAGKDRLQCIPLEEFVLDPNVSQMMVAGLVGLSIPTMSGLRAVMILSLQISKSHSSKKLSGKRGNRRSSEEDKCFGP